MAYLHFAFTSRGEVSSVGTTREQTSLEATVALGGRDEGYDAARDLIINVQRRQE